MMTRRILVALIATLGVVGMAKANPGADTFKTPAQQGARQPDSWQQFMDSEEGRAIQFYGDKARRGEMSMEEAIKAYRDKYHGGKPPNYNAIIEGAQ